MSLNFSSQSATWDLASSQTAAKRSSRIARWAVGLALAGGLGFGVASAHFTGSHSTISATSSFVAYDTTSSGVTGGPGNG